MIEKGPRGVKRRAANEIPGDGGNSDRDETISVLSDTDSAVTAPLDEDGNILNLATYEVLNPPPPKKMRAQHTVSKSKSVRRQKRLLDTE